MAVKAKSRRKSKPRHTKTNQNNTANMQNAAYERFRISQQQLMRDQSVRGRDIGPIPDIANVKRRESCRYSLRKFCTTYNPDAFSLPFSSDQITAITRMEEAVLQGALYAFADPRGDGKTTRCRMAVLWAASYGHRLYPVLIGANDGKATDGLDAIRTYIRFLPLYAEDFPEISIPAQKLGGIAQRAGGQLSEGEPTLIEWSQNRIMLPRVKPPSNWPKKWKLLADGTVPTSGVIIGATGLTADGIRGTVVTTSLGESRRPDLAVIDDPQTGESAWSPTQNATRIRLVSADVLGMAAPGKTMSAVMPCTVICRGDMADQILDRSKHPLWRGERRSLLKSMPTNMEDWQKYFEVYRECALAEPPDFEPANQYYIENRAILDAGAVPSWPERKLDSEISAVQHAMHLYYRDRRAFMSEYQNQPEADAEISEVPQLDEDALKRKLNQIGVGIVPRECNKLTAFVDIGQEILFWAVCGWTDVFGGALLDYGTFPAQPVQVFTAASPVRKLSDLFPKMELRARIYSGLAQLVPQIMGKKYRQADTVGELSPSLCLIDAGYETEAIHDYLSRSPLGALVRASKGRGFGPSSKPMNEYRKEPGDLVGWNWRVDAKTHGKGRFVSFNANAWKTFVAEAMLAPAGASGSFYLPGVNLAAHPLLTLHLLSEYRVPTLGPWGSVQEWKQRPDQRENHWWDCTVGSAVAASVLGVKFSAAIGAGDRTEQPQAAKVDFKAEYERKRKEFEQRRGY